jgi:putative transposase
MSKSIPNVDWANQLESVIRQFVKEKLELIMREEIKNFLEIEQVGTSNMRNGYYQRNLDTQYGRIEGLLGSLETETENFKPNCSLPTNATPAGSRKRSLRCIKVA